MKLYREYLGGGGVEQQKVYGSSIEDINKQARDKGINPVNLQDPYKWSNNKWQQMNQQQSQQPQQGSPPTQQNNTPTIQPQAFQSTSGMGRQVFQRGENLFYETQNGYQKIKSPDQLKSLSQAGFLDTTKGRVGEGYAQLPGTQVEQAKTTSKETKINSKQVFQQGKDLYRETESGVKKIKSPTELKRLSKKGIIDTTIGRTNEGGYTSLDEYLPDRKNEINPAEGVDNIIGGTQSNWDTIFQQAYESGQSVLQNTINSLKEQQSSMLEEQRQLYEQQAQKAQTELEGAKNMDYGQELGDKLRKKYELDKKLNQLGEIGNQMAELQSAYNESVQQTQQSGITIGQSRGELARKQQEYSQKVSVLKARAGVISDQYKLANDVIETYYNSAEQERDRQITRYQELLDNAKDVGLKITEANRKTIQDRIDTLTAKQEEQKANRDAIKALATDPNTAEAFYMSGASLDDSYDKVINKMQPYLGQMAQQQRLAGQGSRGAGYADFTSQEKRKLEQQGIDWTTPQGRQEGLDFLYGEETGKTMNYNELKNRVYKLATQYANQGYNESDIKTALTSQIQDKLGFVPARYDTMINDISWLVSSPEDTRKGGVWGIGGTKRSELESKYLPQKTYNNIEDYLQNNKNNVDTVKKMIKNGLTDQQIAEQLNFKLK